MAVFRVLLVILALVCGVLSLVQDAIEGDTNVRRSAAVDTDLGVEKRAAADEATPRAMKKRVAAPVMAMVNRPMPIPRKSHNQRRLRGKKFNNRRLPNIKQLNNRRLPKIKQFNNGRLPKNYKNNY